VFDERPGEGNFQHAVPVPSKSTVSLEDSFRKSGTGISTQQEHFDIEQLIHAREMCKKDREERVHITDLLETAVFSSVLTDFSEESEHSVKFHDEHQHMDRASGNTECGNTSTAFTIDSESQYLENATDLLQTAISSSGLTDFFEASEHSIEFHDEDQAGQENIDGASENTELWKHIY
ncbi:hypothetical protein MTO96_035342, partial [Rhipicephalus appendiculatus]